MERRLQQGLINGTILLRPARVLLVVPFIVSADATVGISAAEAAAIVNRTVAVTFASPTRYLPQVVDRLTEAVAAAADPSGSGGGSLQVGALNLTLGVSRQGARVESSGPSGRAVGGSAGSSGSGSLKTILQRVV